MVFYQKFIYPLNIFQSFVLFSCRKNISIDFSSCFFQGLRCTFQKKGGHIAVCYYAKSCSMIRKILYFLSQ